MHKHDCEKSVDGSAVLERAIGSDLMYESSIGSLGEKILSLELHNLTSILEIIERHKTITKLHRRI